MRFVSILAVVTAAFVLVSCGGGGSAPVPLGPPSGTAVSMFASLNSLRTANGAGALANNAQLTALAQAQADLNAVNHANNQVDAAGKTVKERLEAGGMIVLDWAVPLARGNDTEAIDRWTDTPAERVLLYWPGYTDMGIGMALDGGVQRWVVIIVEVGP